MAKRIAQNKKLRVRNTVSGKPKGKPFSGFSRASGGKRRSTPLMGVELARLERQKRKIREFYEE